MANPRPANSIKTGEVRNPNGRPKKGETLTDILKLKADCIEETEKLPIKDVIAKKLLDLAIKGDMAAIKYVYDRIDGTPIQSVNLDAKMEGSLTQDFFTITMVDPKEPQSDENTTPSDSVE